MEGFGAPGSGFGALGSRARIEGSGCWDRVRSPSLLGYLTILKFSRECFLEGGREGDGGGAERESALA